jgi:hypothetical protein
MRELERLDNDLESQKARGAGRGGHGYVLPTMSKALSDFLEANKVDLSNDQARMVLRERMRHLSDHAPLIRLTFAGEIDPGAAEQLAAWIRQNLHPQALLAIGMQPSLVGGVYIRTPNHIYDFSLRKVLAGKRGALIEGLHASIARQGAA